MHLGHKQCIIIHGCPDLKKNLKTYTHNTEVFHLIWQNNQMKHAAANENICTFSHVFRPTCVWISFPVTWWLLSSIHSWWQFLIQLQSGFYTVKVCPFSVLSAHSRLRTLIFFCSRCIHLTSQCQQSQALQQSVSIVTEVNVFCQHWNTWHFACCW